MTNQMELQREYWLAHFRSRHRQIDSEGPFKSVDFSNEQVQIQTHAHVLEALGTLHGKSLLDAGCGWGSLSLVAYFLGARPVGVDFVHDTVEALRSVHPVIRWEVADIGDPCQLGALGVFDRVVAVEVLQYLDFPSTVTSLWKSVAPGGRLVGCVPNSLCPIAGGVSHRVPNWSPVSPKEIKLVADALPGAAALQMTGLTFNEDQRFLPYSASAWSNEVTGTPNRLIFAIIRD